MEQLRQPIAANLSSTHLQPGIQTAMATAAQATVNVTDNFERINSYLKDKLDDANFKRMKASFSASGRGRPLGVTSQPLTHKLLLQLDCLRLQLSKSWKEVDIFSAKVVDPELLKEVNLKSEIYGAVQKCDRLKKTWTETACDKFLSVDVGFAHLVKNVGQHLIEHGIYRQHLLKFDTLAQLSPPSQCTNGLVVDVFYFYSKEKKDISGARKTLQFLKADLDGVSDEQLAVKQKQMITKYQSLNKSMKKAHGVENMDIFLSSTPDLSSNTVITVPACFPTQQHLDLAQAERRSACLRRLLEDAETNLVHERQTNNILKEQSVSHAQNLKLTQEQLACLQKKQSELLLVKKKTQQQLEEAQQTIRETTASNMFRRLKRKEREVERNRSIISAYQAGSKKDRQLRHKVKLEQTKSSGLRKQLSRLRDAFNTKVAAYEDIIRQLQLEQLPKAPQTRKDDAAEFTDAVKVTTIALLAAQVSAENCPKIIQTVGKYMFEVDIPLSSLPSERTVRRYADQGHVLAKMQVAEGIVENKFDLHTDGTTRDKKKYVGYQVTTAEGSLSCGFTTVATENASTLVETTMTLLRELSEVFSPEEKDVHFRTMLKNMAGIMSDRAAVMKKFKKDFNATVQENLGTQENIEFLGCNAHFLLGLSSKTSSSLAAIQQLRHPRNGRIGRDLDSQFCRFSQSEAASRYIRMACEVLGPRGDEKNGCRDAWIAFCAFKGVHSTISSFKSNRFNNLFEAAAALHFHRQDIIIFLQDYMPHKNGKLKSVLIDACCDHVAEYTLALAMLFFRLTGPYWQLLGSSIHYLDFHVHVVEMRKQLINWSDNAHEIFSRDPDTLFGRQIPDSAPFRAAVTVEAATQKSVLEIVQPLCKELATVVDLQLSEFLPGGTYHDVTDPNMRQKLSHSKVTNLIGEACFGDLDLSIYKRRNASCRHHATMTMLVRNKTVSSWFDKKDDQQKKRLLKLSATKGQELRKRHAQTDRDVVTARRRILEQNKDDHVQQQAAVAKKKDDIIRALQSHRGPCNTPGQVDAILQKCTLQKERRAFLHLEMSYHKVVLGRKSPLLRTSLPRLDTLANNLKDFLQVHAVGGADDTSVTVSEPRPASPAEQMEMDTDSEEADGLYAEQDSDIEDLSTDEEDVVLLDGFIFTKTGENVAVFYDYDFHVGSVTDIFSEELAEVNFLKKCAVKNNTYVWPARSEKVNVQSLFVFASGFEVTTTTGRVWSVPAHQELCSKYAAYKRKHVQE